MCYEEIRFIIKEDFNQKSDKALIKEPQKYSKFHFISYKMWNLVLDLEKFPDVTLLNVSLFWCSILSPVNLSCFPECILINVEETKSKHLQPVNTTARMLYIRYHKNIFISILFKYMKKKISIQSTLRLRSDLTSIGLKDNLHENKYF